MFKRASLFILLSCLSACSGPGAPGSDPATLQSSASTASQLAGNGDAIQGEGYPGLFARCLADGEPAPVDIILQGDRTAATATATILLDRNGEAREVAPFTVSVTGDKVYAATAFRLAIDLRPEATADSLQPATVEMTVDGVAQTLSLRCGVAP